MIEVIVAFVLSPQFAVTMTAVSAVLAAISGFLGNKHKKSKDTVDMLIQAVEIANNAETKEIVKHLATSHQKIKEIDFSEKVEAITKDMKNKGIASIATLVSDVEKETKIASNVKALISAFQK